MIQYRCNRTTNTNTIIATGMTVFNNQIFSPSSSSSILVLEVSTVSIVHISDTHNRFPDISSLPKGEILIHTGDFSNHGTESEIVAFNHWLQQAATKYLYRIVILGNHDQYTIRENVTQIRSMLINATHVPTVEVIELHGLQILCYPWLNCNPRIHRDKIVNFIKAEYTRLAGEGKVIHIFCSHAPAKGLLDLCDNGSRAGHDSIMTVLNFVRPQVFLFGHVHECHGFMTLKHRRVDITNSSSSSGRSVSFARDIGEKAGNVKATTGNVLSSETLKQTLLVNSSLTDYYTKDITQCAHVIGMKRTVTEELITVGGIATESGIHKISYQLQGILLPSSSH